MLKKLQKNYMHFINLITFATLFVKKITLYKKHTI